MNCRPIAFCLCFFLILGNLASLEAQRRGSRFGKSLQTRVNPRHERIKTEANQASQKADYQKVVRLTTSVLLENPRDHVSLYLRGSARVEIGLRQGNGDLIRKGISDAREAIRFDRNQNPLYHIPYLYGMTNLASVENRKEHAEVALQQAATVLALPALEDEPKSHLLFQRGKTHAYLKNYDDAASDFESAIRLNKAHLGAHVGLSEAYAASGKKRKALESYAESVDSFPDNPLVYNNRGMYLQQQGNLQKAIFDFTRAVEIDPQYYVSYTNRGFALMVFGDPKAAEADYTTSLQINPHQPMVYNMRGSSRLAQGKVKPAIQDQTQVVRLVPHDPLAHADLGFAKFFAEDYSGAQKSFEQAVSLNDKLRHLGPWQYCAMDFSEQSEAAKHKFEAILKKGPAQRDWIDNLVVYLMGEIGDQDLLNAVGTQNEQVKAAQLCEAHFFIGLRKMRAGEKEAAEKHFQHALDTKAAHLAAFRGTQVALKKFAVAGAGSSRFNPQN
jgi:lipoprotein NlpI